MRRSFTRAQTFSLLVTSIHNQPCPDQRRPQGGLRTGRCGPEDGALSVGLKVDVKALPHELRQGIANGTVSLTSLDTTVVLLKLDAVVGLKGRVENIGRRDRLTRQGVTCALCHSTVDNSFVPGIGQRLDGWLNRDLDPGAIIALSPALSEATKAIYKSWGKDRYDPRFNLDGISAPVLIPPAYGLQGLHSITYSGDSHRVAYWNRYVAVTQMGSHGAPSPTRVSASP